MNMSLPPSSAGRGSRLNNPKFIEINEIIGDLLMVEEFEEAANKAGEMITRIRMGK